MSFDDLIEMLDAWAEGGTDAPRTAAGAPALGLHLNTSGYVGESAIAERALSALEKLGTDGPTPRITLVQAYDDVRSDVRDTLSSWEAFGETARLTRLDVVDIATASLTWQPGTPAPRDVVAALRGLDLAVCSSYHTTMLLHRLGVPAYLLTENEYYTHKAEVFGQVASVEEFLAEPTQVADFADEMAARAAWNAEIEPFLHG